ncbi:MAG: hypothetical protein ACOYNL_09285 [Rickettsiales bacterium]
MTPKPPESDAKEGQALLVKQGQARERVLAAYLTSLSPFGELYRRLAQ